MEQNNNSIFLLKEGVDFREELERIHQEIGDFEFEVHQDGIHVANADELVKETRKMIKDIMNSQIYRVFTDYFSKLKIGNHISTTLDDDSEIGLHNIRTQFFLNARKKEQAFGEEKLKGLALEMIVKVDDLKEQFRQELVQIENRINNGAKLTQSRFEVIENSIKNMLSTQAYPEASSGILDDKFKQNQDLNKLNIDRESDKILNKINQISTNLSLTSTDTDEKMENLKLFENNISDKIYEGIEKHPISSKQSKIEEGKNIVGFRIKY